MIGTGFFLIAHILYIIAYTIGTRVRSSSTINKIIRFSVGMLYILMCIGNLYILWDVLPNRILFGSYSIILCIMNVLSVKRYQITTPYSFGFTVAGSILFGLSDNLLGMLKFNGIQSSIGRGFVMLFYYSGQYLLMHGALHHSNLQHQINKFLKNSGTISSLPTLSVGKSIPKYMSRQWDHGDS